MTNTPAKLCSCGCGLPRDRLGQRLRRECYNRYRRSWRAKKRDEYRRALRMLAGLNKDSFPANG